MTLLPDGTGTTHPSWAAIGEGTRHECLDDDNGDTSYVKSSTSGRSMIIEYANPSVAEADIGSITSVQFTSSGRSTARTSASLVDISFNAPTAGFSETESYNPHAFVYETINGTARTTSDGSSAWTYSDLENLEMKCTKNGTVEVRLSYLALLVVYVEAVAPTDNAIFFGTNF